MSHVGKVRDTTHENWHLVGTSQTSGVARIQAIDVVDTLLGADAEKDRRGEAKTQCRYDRERQAALDDFGNFIVVIVAPGDEQNIAIG